MYIQIDCAISTLILMAQDGSLSLPYLMASPKCLSFTIDKTKQSGKMFNGLLIEWRLVSQIGVIRMTTSARLSTLSKVVWRASQKRVSKVLYFKVAVMQV